jgi:hypothetical protein
LGCMGSLSRNSRAEHRPARSLRRGASSRRDRFRWNRAGHYHPAQVSDRAGWAALGATISAA